MPDVAVDALDQFAGGVRVVERHVQPQHVPRQVGTQVVGRVPPQVGGHRALAQTDHLVDQRDAEEQGAGDEQGLECAVFVRPATHLPTRPSGVDEEADYLWKEQVDPLIAEHQRGQEQNVRPARPQVAIQEYEQDNTVLCGEANENTARVRAVPDGRVCVRALLAAARALRSCAKWGQNGGGAFHVPSLSGAHAC